MRSIRTGGREGDREVLEVGEVGAEVFRETDHEVEATVAFVNLADGGAADGGGDELLDVGGGEAVAGEGFAVEAHGEHREAGGLLDFDVGGAGDGLEDGFDFAGGFVHHREIVAVDFHGDIGADAGDEFVETHLDGLRELVVVAGDFLRGGFHGGDEVGFGAERIGPLRARFQHDVGVGDARGHGVGGHFGRAHLGDDAVHLGELFQAVLEFALHGDGLGEAGAGDAEGVHGDVALVEAGDEFGAEASGGEPGEADEHDGGEGGRIVMTKRSVGR